ncbi:MAG: hypothetical protein K2X11_19190 [Acetobacteraceae bacterium]|nr:hypothetical protein [Acetobacteraceae bacterium]
MPASRSLGFALVAAGFVAGIAAAAGVAAARGSPQLHGGSASLLQGAPTSIDCVGAGAQGSQPNNAQIVTAEAETADRRRSATPRGLFDDR